MVVRRDWLQLPFEILELIAEKVVSISDFIRFRSVCTSWRRAAVPSKLRPQPPVLHLPYNIFNPDRYFFSIATRRTHHISLPQLVGKKIFATTNGWMLLIDVETKALSLHNPLSLASIHLPPTTHFEHSVDHGRLLYDRFTDNFVVLIQHFDYDCSRSWFCKVGDESWHVLKFNNFRNYSDRIIYYKGKFFTCTGSNIYIDDDVSTASSSPSLPAGSVTDIAEAWMAFDTPFVTANGELFLLLDFTDGNEGYTLYKLQYSDGERIKWRKVNFEDYAVFISTKDPIMFRVDDFPLYKTKFAYSAGFDDSVVEHTVGIVSCQDGTMDIVECGWERPAGFGHGSMWFTPNF